MISHVPCIPNDKGTYNGLQAHIAWHLEVAAWGADRSGRLSDDNLCLARRLHGSEHACKEAA